MLSLHQINKSFGADPVLRNASFHLNRRDRAGLIGPNGCGKTTLLRIAAGEECADSGSVRRAAGLRLGYLPQGLAVRPGETLHGFLARSQVEPAALERELESLAAGLARRPDDSALQARYDNTLARLSALSQTGECATVPAMLAALGLGEVSLDAEVARLSGGQKTRLALAGVLLGRPQILLLDEPTNHLDVEMLEWLEVWLAEFRGGALIVSHDRAFLDRAVTRILELDPVTRGIREYAGGYTDYAEAKAAEAEHLRIAYDDWRREVASLRDAARHLRGLARFRKGGKADTGDKFGNGFFANRSLGTHRRAKQIESRVERLLTEDRVEKPRASWQIKPEFESTEPGGNDVIVLEDLAVGYGAPLLSGIEFRLRRGTRAAIIGENGSGKTTLLRTLAGLLPPLAGRVRLGAHVRPGLMAQEQETLNPELNALETVLAARASDETEARRFLHKYLFSGDDVFVPVDRLSFGERARLMLALLAAQGCNLLLLDEPVNHLDILSRMRFEDALAAYDGTVLTVIHDRYFLARFAQEIWAAEGGTLVRRWLNEPGMDGNAAGERI